MSGIVYLVGAGPGDPGLMTRRSLELIARADAILYDRLIPPGALDGARPEAELRYVGKEPGAAAVTQEETNQLLVELARAGKRVVRLKGGDPFVFGRGGEEAEALAAAGVPFEVVPGVTAGVAAPAYAGIPVTHRDAASAVAFVTGHEDPDKPEAALDWDALARFPGTLVLYMGIRNLALIAERLTAAGRDPDEPVAVVERGTHPGQRTIVGTLDGIAARVEADGVRPPAITLVGPVAGLRDTIAWLERRPLHGEVVAVTRTRAQASALAARLRELGADVVETPAIRIEPRPLDGELLAAVQRISDYALVCLTSPNGVRLLFDALAETGHDARALARATVAAIGPGTAAALERRGVRADVLPEQFVAEALVEALEPVEVEGRRVLVARAAGARSVVPDALCGRGAEVDDVAFYETVAEPLGEAERAALARATYVTFTSSSTVRFLLESGARPPEGARVVSIGPVTSATAHEHGLAVHAEAERHDLGGLVEALTADAAQRRVPA
ncbi:MAG TPA: uroporphyrinogen-III C-methyltransferase [Thermoleophilaceae bacterium]|nr:uroporphyrinogen-III C-methyltransferase [Thermoleophilaceae bacterium]